MRRARGGWAGTGDRDQGRGIGFKAGLGKGNFKTEQGNSAIDSMLQGSVTVYERTLILVSCCSVPLTMDLNFASQSITSRSYIIIIRQLTAH